MNDFAAIDFETANAEPSSVCSVGIVIIRNGQVADNIYRLIRPLPDYYSENNTSVHGLTEKDTLHAPAFPDVWSEIAPKIAGLPLAAHNSRFDESCLHSAHQAYGMSYPPYRFICTRNAARKIFGRTLPDHRLPTVAAYCGYTLKNHHHALADAEACAAIVRYLWG
ncbi:MAG: 3'-5' exonuclease [Bacteroidales bacterium]|nr:3'-5' exonuclease [Bacteroidales bacterium]